jgi:hypothetical protein
LEISERPKSISSAPKNLYIATHRILPVHQKYLKGAQRREGRARASSGIRRGHPNPFWARCLWPCAGRTARTTPRRAARSSWPNRYAIYGQHADLLWPVVGVVVVVVVVVVVCVCVCVCVWEHLAPSTINYNYCFWLLAVGSPRRRKPAPRPRQPRRGRGIVFRNSRISLSAGRRALKPAMPGAILVRYGLLWPELHSLQPERTPTTSGSPQ